MYPIAAQRRVLVGQHSYGSGFVLDVYGRPNGPKPRIQTVGLEIIPNNALGVWVGVRV